MNADATRWQLAMLPLVAAAGIACGITVLLITVFNYFVIPMGIEFALSRAQTAGAISIHLAVLVLALPAAGALADRFGARPVILVSSVALGAALLCIARFTASRWELYLGFAAAGVAGAGASPVTYARVLVHSFRERRGLALGVALTGTGLGGILLPALIRPIVMAHGWRPAMELLGILAAGVGILAGLAMGHEQQDTSARAGTEDSLLSAASTAAFWKMALGFAVLGLVLAGVIAHLTEIWQALHWNTAQVPVFQATVGFATIAGRLAGGALMDKIPANLVGSAAALCGAGGLALLAGSAGAVPTLIMVGVAIGICTGTESDVVSYLSSRYFGLLNFARIYATVGAFFMIGFALGPIAAARSFDRIGVPTTLLIGSAMLVASSLILLSLPRYTKQEIT